MCLDQNYYSFNGTFYRQTSGLPIGFPISGLFPNISLDVLESHILNLSPKIGNTKFWYLYVDIISLWTGSTNFFHSINPLNPSIQFTMEIEENESLNFLDLSISHTTPK